MKVLECAARIGKEAISVTSDGLTHYLNQELAVKLIEEAVATELERCIKESCEMCWLGNEQNKARPHHEAEDWFHLFSNGQTQWCKASGIHRRKAMAQKV